jgi:hypothetical protein
MHRLKNGVITASLPFSLNSVLVRSITCRLSDLLDLFPTDLRLISLIHRDLCRRSTRDQDQLQWHSPPRLE